MHQLGEEKDELMAIVAAAAGGCPLAEQPSHRRQRFGE